MSTIKDVAKRAGVSLSTVSNIINGKGAVGTEKYKKVKAAMEELHYHPSFIAQNLRNNRSRLIGVVLPHMEDPYNSMFQGIHSYFESHKYYCVVRLTDDIRRTEEEQIKNLLALGVCGIILVPCNYESLSCQKLIHGQNLPLVLLERNVKNYDCSKIWFDYGAHIKNCTSDLLKENAGRRLLLICHKAEDMSAFHFEQALKQYSANHDASAILTVSRQRSDFFKAIFDFLLNNENAYDHLITTNIRLAQAARDAAEILGQRYMIHALTGDTWQLSPQHDSVQPIALNTYAGGIQAASLLLDKLKNPTAENQTMKVKPKLCRAQQPPEVRRSSKNALRILAMDCTATSVLEKLSTAAERELGIQVQFETLPPNELPAAAEQELLDNRCEHDIFMIDMPWLQHIVNQDLLYDIGSEIAGDLISQFPKSIEQSFLKNLKHRNIVPVIAGLQVLCYRRDIFENPDYQAGFFKKYGIQLAAPRNWTEFNHICEYFTRSQNPDSPFAFGTAMSTDYDINLANEYLPRQWAFRGQFMDEYGTLCLDDDANFRALESIRTTYRFTPNNLSGLNLDDEVFSLLFEGQIPIAHGFANHYIPEKYLDNGIHQHIQVCPSPSRQSLLSGWALGVNRSTSHVSACCAYLKWLLTDRISLTNMRLGGCIPTLAVHENADLRRQYPWLGFMSEAFARGRSRNMIFDKYGNPVDSVQFDFIIANALRDAFHTGRGSRDILREAQVQLSSLIYPSSR